MQNILIIEDSKTQAVRLQMLLEENGYKTHLASNGKAALEILPHEQIDLIISDIVMPEMNGFEFCKQLKSDRQYQSIPIILLTSLDKIIDVLRGLSVGADNYISKPYNDKYLLYKVNQILNNNFNIKLSDDNTQLEINIGNEELRMTSSPTKILNFFISSYEASTQINRTLQNTKDKLEELNETLEQKVKTRTLELETEVASHKNTLRELSVALDKTRKLDELKTEFLHNLSHEIRTPMNAIIGFTELLNDHDLDKNEISEFLPHISTSLEILLNIINDMLEAAETVSGNVEIKKSDCYFDVFFDEILRSHQAKMEAIGKTNLQLNYRIEDELKKQKVNTYTEKLKVVLDKLLSNAVKFSSQGKVEFGVKLLGNHKLIFHVKDQGPGIPQNQQDEIYECFRQLQIKGKAKSPGTGVGLTIAKKLIEMMNGSISLESKPGKGSTFYFEIPYFGEIIKEKETITTDSSKLDLKDLTILLAEDVETNYYLIKTITERQKIRLIWARNGVEAVKLYDRYQEIINLVLMDIQMPEMDGTEATRIIKEKHPESRIIALTAYSSDLENDQFLEKGFSALIKKPVRPSILMEIIKKEFAFTK